MNDAPTMPALANDAQRGSVRLPCAQCPFRADSPLSYDADAIAALDDGYEPSCHSVVGLGVVFEDWNPDDAKRCVGYEHWANGDDGFMKPIHAEPR
jgi:hypothetical protein